MDVKTNKKKLLMGSIVLALLFVCIIIVGVGASNDNNRNYEKAKERYSSGNYEEAYYFFSILPDSYRDVKTLKEISYRMKNAETIEPTELKELKEEDIDANVSLLTDVYDSFDETHFYYSSHSVFEGVEGNTYYNNCENGLYFYIVRKGNEVLLRSVFKYSGDDWIFFDKIAIKTGGEVYDISINEYDVKRDVHDSGSVTEVYDCVASEELIDIADKILENKDGVIKLSGDKEYITTLAPAPDRIAIREVVTAYETIMKTIE